MTRLAVATVASNTVWRDASANIALHEKHVRAVKKKWPQTDIILFPEMSLTGFVVDASNAEIAEPLGGSSVAAMQRMASQHGVAICSGLIERNVEGGKPYNTQIVVGKNGAVLATYRKNHLFTESAEPDVYTPGDALAVFELDGWRCGLSTCFDIRFPRLFEAYRMAGVELMLSGFNWVQGRNKPEIMKSLVKARAHENQYFLRRLIEQVATPILPTTVRVLSPVLTQKIVLTNRTSIVSQQSTNNRSVI